MWDSLFSIMPELKNQIKNRSESVNPIDANCLYGIWKNGTNAGDNKTFKRPDFVHMEEINRMKNAGLIQSIDDKIKITDKGEKIIKTMILGDDRSSFNDNGISIDYSKALNNTRGVKTAKKHKFASWWDRFE